MYLSLVNGRLVDDNGNECNYDWPTFNSYECADKYLVDNDIRASIR